MKKRNPVAAYILIWLTFGIYQFYWLFVSMKEVNELAGEIVFNVREKFITLFAILVPEFIVMLIFEIYPPVFNSSFAIILSTVAWVSGLAWMVMLFVYYAQLGKSIGQLEKKYSLDKPASGGIAVLLIFLWFTVIPYLQSHKNRFIDKAYLQW